MPAPPRIFLRVTLPFLVLGLLAVLLINIVAAWNNCFLPLLIVLQRYWRGSVLLGSIAN